jgi:hypothetical protein
MKILPCEPKDDDVSLKFEYFKFNKKKKKGVSEF